MLRIADEPGNIIVENALPPAMRLTGIQCSTAHITDADNSLLFTLSHQHEDFGDSEWIMYTGPGYLLRLGAWSFPALRLKRLGLSKPCRRLIVTLIQSHGIDMLDLMRRATCCQHLRPLTGSHRLHYRVILSFQPYQQPQVTPALARRVFSFMEKTNYANRTRSVNRSY